MKSQRGITLIALIITIIVLLILAGITIALVIGDNGILSKSKDSKMRTEVEQAIEQAKIGIMAKVTENLGNNATDEQIKEVLNQYFNDVPTDLTDRNQELKTKESGYKVKLSEILSDRALAIVDDTSGHNMSGNEITGDIENYVTDGLIVWYDGIQNTRAGNNPNAVVWEDLSENGNDGIFSEAMAVNQSEITEDSKGYYDALDHGYVFLHNDAFIESTNNLGIEGDSLFTIELVLTAYSDGRKENYSPRESTRFALWFGKDAWELGTNVSVQYLDKSDYCIDWINYHYRVNSRHDNLDTKYTMSFVKNVAGTIESGNTELYKIFKNGKFMAGRTDFSGQYNIQNSPVVIGRGYQFWDQSSRTIYGVINSVRIYNRALTEAEIIQNSNTDKVRYNIPCSMLDYVVSNTFMGTASLAFDGDTISTSPSNAVTFASEEENSYIGLEYTDSVMPYQYDMTIMGYGTTQDYAVILQGKNENGEWENIGEEHILTTNGNGTANYGENINYSFTVNTNKKYKALRIINNHSNSGNGVQYWHKYTEYCMRITELKLYCN